MERLVNTDTHPDEPTHAHAHGAGQRGLGLSRAEAEGRALLRTHEPLTGRRSLRRALGDLREGFADWRLWTYLAKHEIRSRYRRSALGPLWITLSTTIQILAMGLVWGTLFNIDSSQFIPYLTLGIVIWSFIVGVVSEGCLVFATAGGFIIQTNRALSTYVLQLVLKNLLVWAHTAVVYLGVAAFFRVEPTMAMLVFPVSLALFVAAIGWTPLVFGALGTRFRDIPQIVQSILMVAFFVTPVMWRADMLGTRAFIATINPLTHLIDLVRQPLLGVYPSGLNWAVAVATAVLGWVAAIAIFARVRARIAYWV